MKPRGLLIEGAKGVRNLPDGIGVIIYQSRSGFRVGYVHMNVTGGGRPALSDSPKGGVMAAPASKWTAAQYERVPCDGAYAIGASKADQGWGPLLYDVAMEVATLIGGGLTSDREIVSAQAHRVWQHYLNQRSDVKSHQLDNPNDALTKKVKDNCVQQSAMDHAGGDGEQWNKEPESKRYTKKPTQLTALRQHSKLMIWNFTIPGFTRKPGVVMFNEAIDEMAVASRVGTDALFRSVSPWELEDIIKRGRVTGKGSWFSGDRKRTGTGVWFGVEIEHVKHHGMDWRRYLESTSEFRRAFKVKTEIEILRNIMSVPWNAEPQVRWRWPQWKSKISSQLTKLFGQFQDRLFKRLGEMTARVTKSQEKQAAAYVIEVSGVAGGTVYSGEHSLAGRMNRDDPESPPEILVPSYDDPVIERGARIPLKSIARIHAIGKDRKTIKVFEQPANGWRLDLFGKKGVNAPDVQKALAAMDKITNTVEARFRKVQQRASQEASKTRRHKGLTASASKPAGALVEVLDNPLPWRWAGELGKGGEVTTNSLMGSSAFSGYFDSEDGKQNYWLVIWRTRKLRTKGIGFTYEAEAHFWARNNGRGEWATNITGTAGRDVFRVYATIAAMLRDAQTKMVKLGEPSVWRIWAKTGEPKRISLYRRLAQHMARALGWKVAPGEATRTMEGEKYVGFEVVRPKPAYYRTDDGWFQLPYRVDESREFRDVGSSPLKYRRASNVQRIVLCDTNVTDPPKRGDTYFDEIERWRRYSTRTGRRLKTPVLDEIIPGVDDNCIVAFLDYHKTGTGSYYLDYMKSRQDARGQGYIRAIVDHFYKTHPRVKLIHWGKMMHPAVGHLLDAMKQRYPEVDSIGAVNY